MSSLLHKAVLENDFGVVLDLTARGWDVNARYDDYLGCTPLHLLAEKPWSVKNNPLRLLKVLTDFGADVNCLNKYRKSPLHLAVTTFNSPLVEHLLRYGAVVDTRDYLNQTPLHIISCQVSKNSSDLRKQIKILRMLLQRGADVSAVTSHRETPVFLATRYGVSFEFVKILVNYNANVNCPVLSDGSTPLHYASLQFDKKLIKLLVRNGACVNPTDINGRTPLMWALERLYSNYNKKYEQALTVLTLLMYGADVNLRDLNNNNILNIHQSMDSDCCEVILEHLVILQNLKFEINSSLLDTISSQEDLNSYFFHCRKECLEIKRTRIVEYPVFFFDLLIGNERKLLSLSRIESLVYYFVDMDLKESFPIYASYMYKNLFRAIKRRRLFDKAAELLEHFFSDDEFSDSIIEDILLLLSKSELKKLCEQL